ncbi:MAG: hypothetical protein DCF13_04535 [Flavobacteriaceae bacterium]|nr:MAG: hypothetical protein DCF13_04535 [Flavobacteriaceae bacterium]
MNKFEATYTEITDWQKNVHYSTGGTRSKYIALNPDTNEEYFFKGSKETPLGEIRYPTEFWSEIVSSKIGQFLGFEMLDYNIAYDENHKQKIGCLSKSMILHSENKLTEGIAYLTGFNPNYNSEKDKIKYTFQFINKALIYFNLAKYGKNIVEIIVFDSIIGNSDRHQENWGIIMNYNQAIKEINYGLSKEKLGFWEKIDMKFKRFLNEFFILLHKENRKISKTNLKLHSEITLHQFAPIYDSGCCLGREYEEEKIKKMINDSQMLMAYINKGKSEIHWEGLGEKSKHFELVALLLEKYPKEVKRYIHRVKDKFDSQKINEIIQNIDTNLPPELINFKLSDSRKILMFKLITLRIEILLKLI